ncbi:hypothetical protein ACT3SP_04705 [Brachybacterium sp. AOP43-C2-M15]|uniref:hypothetical protein n=1 Tax=Brachybacterium sp. AOP43-C2-M15 TaxID=3457661 RepID=UPI0040337301
MSFDLEPTELLACALTAVMLAIPIAFPLAAAAIAGPRRTWNSAGLAMGIGLLLGVVLAGAGAVALPREAVATPSSLALLLGLVGAIVSAVLVVALEDGTRLTAAIGIVACALIGFGEPGQALPALFGLSTSLLVVLAAVVIEAVALVVIVGALVAAAGRARALQIGIAVAGAVAAVLMGLGILFRVLHETAGVAAPHVSLGVLLVSVLVALALGSITGGVLETVRARRRAPAATTAS